MTHIEAVCYAANHRQAKRRDDRVVSLGMTSTLADRLSSLLASILVADLRTYPPGTPLPNGLE